jgi:hypothetical protein
MTRKEFLASATKGAAAASVGAIGMGLVTASPGQAAVPSWPWPYTTLDPEDVRKRAHKSYYDGGCGYGAFNGIVSALTEKVGEPYTLMPTQITYFEGGGAAGWGTLCGALNGAALAINLVVDRTNTNSIVSELIGWYTTVALPTDISNDYAQAHVFLVNRYDKALTQSVAGGPLCHTSVSKWCTVSGFKAAAAERAERCARLTGDVAAQAVQLINDFKAGAFRATFQPARSVTGCMGCHDSAMGNVQSGVKMDCQQCHVENFQHLY